MSYNLNDADVEIRGHFGVLRHPLRFVCFFAARPCLSPPHLLVPTFLSLGSGSWIRKALSSIPASATTEWVRQKPPP